MFRFILFLTVVVLVSSDFVHRPSEVPSAHYDAHGHHDATMDHEAVLGSKKMAAEFQELTPEESKARLRKLIDRMDTSSDEKVSKQELVAWVKMMMERIDLEETKSNFEEIDINHDGAIDFLELLKHSYGLSETEWKKHKKDVKNPYGKQLEEEENKFNVADRNKDSHLDHLEFVAFMRPYHYGHMAPLEIKHTIGALDMNNDGLIDLKEFTAHMTPEMAAQETTAFHRYDTNKDGLLEKKEIIEWLMPTLDTIAVQEAEHLMTESDADKDGFLTPEEILNKHDLWVGSRTGAHMSSLKFDEL